MDDLEYGVPTSRTPILCAALLLMGSCGGGEPAAPSEPGLTVMILIDTLRADHVGAYGDRKLTPHLDAFAAEATLFENAYSTSTWTRPAVASMFMGYMPTRLGVETKESLLPAEVKTLGEYWKEDGRDAFAISTNGNAGPTWGFDRGFHTWTKPTTKRSHADKSGKLTGDGVTDRAIAMLDEPDFGKGDLLWVHYVDPHDPFFSHEEGVEDSIGSQKELKALDRMRERDEAKIAEVRRLYEGEVSFVDREVGRLLEELKSRGLYDDALIIITSDHGEGLWDHGRRAHGEKPFEEQVAVPLMAHFPTTWDWQPGQRVGGVHSLLDVLPTVLHAHAIERPEDLPGANLYHAAKEGRSLRDEAPFAINHSGVYFDGRADARNKLIRNRHTDLDLVGRTHVTTGERNLYQIYYIYCGSAWHYPGAMRRFVKLNSDQVPEDHDLSAKLPAGMTLKIPDIPLEGLTEEFYDLHTDPRELAPLERPGWGAGMLERDRERRLRELEGRFLSKDLAPSEVDAETAAMLVELGYTDS